MYESSLDLNMGYYHIELSSGDKQLCKIVLPWGKYKYQNLPMGVSNSPDIFQEKISKLFNGFDMIGDYIDVVIVRTKNKPEDHLKSLDSVWVQAGLMVMDLGRALVWYYVPGGTFSVADGLADTRPIDTDNKS